MPKPRRSNRPRVAHARFSIVTTLACAAAVPAQEPDAVRDLHTVVALLRAVHPDPHRHVSAAALDAAVAREVEHLESLDAPSDVDLGGALHRVLARVGDSHLAVALPSFQPGARTDAFLLPLLPKRSGDRVFVDASEPSLPDGTELLRVDDTGTAALFAELATHALVDGDRPDARLARVERDFTLHFHLARGTRSEYGVRVRLPDGQEQDLRLPAVRPTDFAQLRGRRVSAPVWGPAASETPALPWLVTPSESAALPTDVRILRLPTFGVSDQEAYRARVDALFAGLGDETLVLDLRGNAGGLRTNGIAVLEHLIDGPYAQWTQMATRVREIPAAFREQVTFPFTPPTALAEFAGERRGARYVYAGDPLAARMQGRGRRHAGRVLAFVDDATNSAAVEMMAALLSKRPEVVVVGTETIGACDRHVGEVPILFTGTTGVRVLMSVFELTHVPTGDCRPGRGVVPDVIVRLDEVHYLQRSDPFLTALAELLRD